MKTHVYSPATVWPRIGLFGLLLAVALTAPAFGWPQPITGTMVNATLLLTVELLGVGPAIALGCLTPLGGLLHGILPLPLAVMTPFIMLGNATLVSLYSALRGRNRWLALGLGAGAKFALLTAAVTLLAARPLELMWGGAARSVVMPAALVNMMSWPQLATAVSGGLLAFAALRIFRNQVS